MMNRQYMNQINRKKVNGPSAAVLRYDEAQDKIPSIIAHGSGQVAGKIIELAKKNNIHMEEDASLVANLLDVDLGEGVPPQLYAVIAEIFILLEEMEKSY